MLVKGSRVPTIINVGGYLPQAIVIISNYEGMPRNIIVEEDNCFKYHSDVSTGIINGEIRHASPYCESNQR